MKTNTEINEKKLRKIVNKNASKQLVLLYKWLYDNHLNVLREFEKSQGYKGGIEFA